VKALVANPKERTKFEGARTVTPPTELELSLGHLQSELERIDALVRLAVARWQQAGRDPYDAFRGLVVSDDEANQLSTLPFGAGWGDISQEDEGSRLAIDRQARAARQSQNWLDQAAQFNTVVRLQHLQRVFGLNSFEMDTLLLCVAPALDLRYEQLFSYLQNDINRKRPRVNLALQM
jgi:hypothetical protein